MVLPPKSNFYGLVLSIYLPPFSDLSKKKMPCSDKKPLLYIGQFPGII
jgi:hypothetical protein